MRKETIKRHHFLETKVVLFVVEGESRRMEDDIPITGLMTNYNNVRFISCDKKVDVES